VTALNLEAIALRFWRKVDQAGPDDCWTWKACVDRGGYGRITVAPAEQNRLAHRVAWLLTYGEWPNGCALHRCDNRLCVNPSHLFEGTKAENNIDRDRKGRHRALRGSSNGFSRLTEESVREARACLAAGVSQSEVARRLGVHCSTINLMAAGATWKHV
jgi:hypothetical protein